MEKIVARRDPFTFLVQTGPNEARVLDSRQGIYFDPFNMQSILARGYWQEYAGSAEELAAAKAKCRQG